MVRLLAGIVVAGCRLDGRATASRPRGSIALHPRLHLQPATSTPPASTSTSGPPDPPPPCLPPQAVFLGALLTAGWADLDRLPLAFKSAVQGATYR